MIDKTYAAMVARFLHKKNKEDDLGLFDNMQEAMEGKNNNNPESLLEYNIGFVKGKIEAMLQEIDSDDVEAIATFRLKFFEEDLERIYDICAENIMVDREYEEFIKLLKYFVDVSESKYKEVTITFEKDNKITICDEANKDITSELMKEDESGNSVSLLEDNLLGALVSVAPKKIKIINKDNSKLETLNTLNEIFQDKLEII